MTDPTQAREALVLEHARRGLAPSRAQRSVALARLGTALAAGNAGPSVPGSNTSTAPPATTSPTTATTFSLRALVAGVIGGFVVGFGGGHFVARHTVGSPSVSLPSSSAPAHEPHPGPDVIVTEPPAPPASITAPLPSAKPSHGSAPSASALRAHVRAETSRPGAAPSANYDELSYVQRAQTALRNGDPALALGLMRTLDEQQPSGALGAERTVLSALALCQLGRVEEARAVASGLLRGNEANVYRRRLENSCVGHETATDSDGSAAAAHQ
jgi:hypothetical protein